MAVKGKIENEYGAQFEYHKISDVRITSDDKNGIVLSIIIDSYKDKEARITGKTPTRRQCSIIGADFALTPFYALLKAKFPEFRDIEDDFDNEFKKVENKEVKPEPLFVEQAGKYVTKWNEKEAAKEVKEEEKQEKKEDKKSGENK